MLVRSTYEELQHSLQGDEWKIKIPGKPKLAVFAASANIPLGRLKSLYISKNPAEKRGAFDEIAKNKGDVTLKCND